MLSAVNSTSSPRKWHSHTFAQHVVIDPDLMLRRSDQIILQRGGAVDRNGCVFLLPGFAKRRCPNEFRLPASWASAACDFECFGAYLN